MFDHNLYIHDNCIIGNTIEFYNNVAKDYTKKRERLVNYSEIAKLKTLMKGKFLLDAGTGPGRDAKIFSEEGFTTIGIDLSWKFLQIALNQVPRAVFLEMDVRKLSFTDDSFDGIWCSVVLPHLTVMDTICALSEFKRVLKNDGILLTIVKAGSGNIISPTENTFNQSVFMQLYSKEQYYSIVQNIGFEIIENYIFNEKGKFGKNHRDMDFIVTLCRNVKYKKELSNQK